MVEQSTTLLQIIQFIGLISPAIAILMELLLRTHGGIEDIRDKNEIPVEVQILFMGFISILAGGFIIGVQFIQILDNRITQIGIGATFLGLPILALSVLLMNVRLSGRFEDKEMPHGIVETIKYMPFLIKYTISLLLAPAIAASIYVTPIYYSATFINSNLNWWLFTDEVQPVWFFYVLAIILSWKLVYSLWNAELYPTTDYSSIAEHMFVIGLAILLFIGLFALPSFGIIQLLSIYNVIEKSSNWTSIPYIITVIITTIILAVPLQQESDEEENNSEESKQEEM